ncbi:hypothetical protein HDK90DRAFT_142760 [Phyllosticta capitalensis]|uniref:Uncharacterized protein n=1 Tax=Phyllosticta capitalensis TaxID=121624 RepID=A0ABR1YZ92_9PEZI
MQLVQRAGHGRRTKADYSWTSRRLRAVGLAGRRDTTTMRSPRGAGPTPGRHDFKDMVVVVVAAMRWAMGMLSVVEGCVMDAPASPRASPPNTNHLSSDMSASLPTGQHVPLSSKSHCQSVLSALKRQSQQPAPCIPPHFLRWPPPVSISMTMTIPPHPSILSMSPAGLNSLFHLCTSPGPPAACIVWRANEPPSNAACSLATCLLLALSLPVFANAALGLSFSACQPLSAYSASVTPRPILLLSPLLHLHTPLNRENKAERLYNNT